LEKEKRVGAAKDSNTNLVTRLKTHTDQQEVLFSKLSKRNVELRQIFAATMKQATRAENADKQLCRNYLELAAHQSNLQHQIETVEKKMADLDGSPEEETRGESNEITDEDMIKLEESVALTEAVKRLEELDTTYGSTFNSALTNLDRLQQFVQASGDNQRQDALIKINMELDETVSRVKQEREEINRWIEMKREDFNQRRNELLTQLRDVSQEISANKNEMY